MRNVAGWSELAGVALGIALVAPAFAQGPVEISKSAAPSQTKQFEIVAPGPAARDVSRVPEANFYRDDQRVPYDPAFISPLTGTTKGGTKYGASGWTAPQTPVGSLGSQIYQQNSGWFGFGITFIWDSPPPPAGPAR